MTEQTIMPELSVLIDEICQLKSKQDELLMLLHVVIRGIPAEIAEEYAKENLEKEGYYPDTVKRMKSGRDKKPLPLMLVKLSKSEKSIYQITNIVNLKITVETLRQQPRLAQCYRCQKFGHACTRCTAVPKCVKCAGNHFSYECKKDKNTPASCANCRGGHTASYKGCPNSPRPKQTVPARRVGEKTFVEIAKNKIDEGNNANISLPKLFENFQNMYRSMETMSQ